MLSFDCCEANYFVTNFFPGTLDNCDKCLFNLKLTSGFFYWISYSLALIGLGYTNLMDKVFVFWFLKALWRFADCGYLPDPFFLRALEFFFATFPSICWSCLPFFNYWINVFPSSTSFISSEVVFPRRNSSKLAWFAGGSNFEGDLSSSTKSLSSSNIPEFIFDCSWCQWSIR